MSELVDRAVDVARDAISGALCNAAGVSRVASDLAGKVNPRYDSSPGGRVSRAAQRALERFCPVPPSPPLDDYLPTNPGFDGGQCPGRYTVNYTVTTEGEPSGSGQIFPFGPVLGVVRATDSTGLPGIAIRSGSPPTDTFIVSGAIDGTDVKIDSVIPFPGNPDDCGDPAPLPPDEDPPPPSTPTPPGTIININLPGIGPVDIEFSPTIGIIYVGPSFDIRVPVSVKISGPTANIDFNVDIDFNLSDPTEPPTLPPESPPVDPDGRPEPPDCPPPIECDEEPSEEEPEDELPEQDDEERPQQVLAGVFFVTAIGPRSKATEIFQDENPNIFAPALGYCAFAYELPDGDLIWSQDFPVKNTRAIIPAPDVGLRCVLARGTPNPGVSWLARAIVGRKGCK